MLRITRVVHDGTTAVRLEGKLLEPWVESLRAECAVVVKAGGRPVIDLSAVTFVDAAGAAVVREFMAAGYEVAGCRGFIGELLGAGQGEQ
jgi:anti-anti-sigma regulatory factor